MEYDVVQDQATQDRLRSLLGLMRPMKAVGVEKKRYGRDWDGGYVVLSTVEKAEVIYSLGISDDVSFDELMADFGIEIYQYDHTVDGPPVAHPRFHFHKIGIAASDDWLPEMRRLDTLVRQNGHEGNEKLFLKIDIEGHEWDTYDQIDPAILAQFDQIAGEFHSFGNVRNLAWLERAERALTKLHQTHQVVHVHANNNDTFARIAGLAIPGTLELTWARRSSYEFAQTDETFPTPLDMPCTPARPDMVLGGFVF
ncbi:FkbM family methyltransferase [Novosphingobium lentum]|uniref:FkbM family methyltransferase n=1 Tax=Novosphingobium lentum TaxID=145287 RepID=UPI00082F7072|nr:FkbM family methyltransferase [Novosphingobium lentum]